MNKSRENKIIILVGLVFLVTGTYLTLIDLLKLEPSNFFIDTMKPGGKAFPFLAILGLIMIFYVVREKLRKKSVPKSKNYPWDKIDKPKNFEEWFFSELSWKQWGLILLFSFVGLALFGITLSLIKPNP
jgi:hypothetical protein